MLLSNRAQYSTLRVVLCHSYRELATDADVVVLGVTPFPLLVGFDLYSSIWRSQVRRRIGQLNLKGIDLYIDPYRNAATLEDAGIGVRGLSLCGRLDPRWRYKEAELEELRALSGSCTSWHFHTFVD